MIDDADLIRHLEEGGDELWNRPEPPALDLHAIIGGPAATSASTSDASSASRADTPLGAAPAPASAEAPIAPRPAPRRHRGWLLPRLGAPLGALTGALACVALGVALGAALFKDDATSPVAAPSRTTTALASSPERRIVLTRLAAAPTSAGGDASVIASPAGGKTIAVRLHGMPHIPHGSFLEAWVLGRDGKMVSLGALRVDDHGAATADLRLPVSLNRFPTLDISLERADGNPAHSTDSMLRGTA